MISAKAGSVWVSFAMLMAIHCRAQAKPHIIFILADDLGWDDVGFHGSSQIPTPNIDELANKGVILNNYYVSPICTPTRASVMTGKYPIHMGIQHFVIFAAQPYGLPLEEVTIAQYLKTMGYATHGVGKWHLGFYTKEYTPVYRGFDSFYGFWNGKEDYWDHSSFENSFDGFDLRANMEPVANESGVYGTELFTREAVKVINSHDASRPMFLYLAQQAVHSANPKDPLQAPQRLTKAFNYIKHPQRRTYAGMVTALDKSVRDIKQALQSRGMLQNSVIIFSTDNGGAPWGFNWNMGSNFPFRAGKDTVWEGGVRGTAFVYSDLIQNKGRVSNELLDVTDWVPTLFHLAGGNPDLLANLDGKNVWSTISSGSPSPRDEVLHNIDPRRNFAAIRKGKFKLVVGQDDTYKIGWHERYPNKGTTTLAAPQTLPGAVIHCGAFDEKKMCDSTNGGACLFDMSVDPCEYHDVSSQYPEVVKLLKDRLAHYRSTAKPVWYPAISKSANPENFNKFWTPWMTLQDNSSVLASWTTVEALKVKQHLLRDDGRSSNSTAEGVSVDGYLD